MRSSGEDDVTLAVGTLVDGRYRIRREVARGGMGVVFEAEHVVLGQTVALKLLRPSVAQQPALRARITREARALAGLRHVGIVSIKDAGTCPTAGPFIALEMLEGRPLDGVLAVRAQLPVVAAVGIARELGAALTHAHSAGVFHRDVKPGNVHIAPCLDTGGDRAVLLDFGIARVADARLDEASRLTRSGELLGTPEYMAPEILLDALEPDARTDVYSLAVTLYECLTGEPPYPGRAMAIMAAMLEGRTPRPVAEFRSDVPPALDALIASALSRDPARRPSSAEAFGIACAAAIGGAFRLDLLQSGPKASTDGRLPSSAPTVRPARLGASVSRRQHVRAAYVAPARVIGAAGACDGRTEDLSEGGSLIAATSARPAEGEEIAVRMPLPISGRVAVLRAIARWSRTRRGAQAIGIEFVDLPADARAEIARYVRLVAERAEPSGVHASLRPTAATSLACEIGEAETCAAFGSAEIELRDARDEDGQ